MKIFKILMWHAILVLAASSNRLQTFITGTQLFAASLYTEIAKNEGGNFIVSPISVQSVLALAAVGARGKTADELSSTLQIPKDNQEIEKTFDEITTHLKKGSNYTLVSADKIYTNNTLELDVTYKSSAIKNFHSEVESVNFLDAQIVDQINSWVSKSTFGKIQNLIKPNSFNNFTQMVLINIMYFKGFWGKAFKTSDTKKMPFFLSQSEETEVEMMEITNKFKYAYNDKLKAQFLELFYNDSDISMIIILPSNLNDLAQLEKRVGEIFEQQFYYNAKVHAHIPKFTTKSTLKLNNILINLGIKEAFGDLANFTGMGCDKEKLVRIDEVLQKASIEVDEEGTTAVAAIEGITGMLPTIAEILVQFNANHPFIYYLKSKSVGVLFIGRYLEP